MNKVFKVIWSEARNAYVVVSEMAKSHGSKSCSTKKLLAMLIATGIMTCASVAPVMAATNVDDSATVNVGKKAEVNVGANAKVDVDQKIAIGINANAQGAYSVAIGNSAVVTGLGGVAVGRNSEGAENSVALGSNVKAAGFNSVAIGNSAKTSELHSIAIGYKSESSKASAIAIGNEAKATGMNSFAFGQNANASGESSVAFGNGSKATHLIAIAIGSGAEATEVETIAIGGSAKATSLYSVAIGNHIEKTGEKAVAIGQQTRAYGKHSTAVGAESQAQYTGATAIGTFAKATKEGSIALGYNSYADREAGVKGYDPLTGKESTLTSLAWKSGKGALSIGSAGGARQIINVAAGSKDTDAVNVAQLKRVGELATAAKTEIKKGDNIAFIDAKTAKDGHTIYTINAKGTKVSGDDNFVINSVEEEGNVTNYKLKLANTVKIGSRNPVQINGTAGTITGLTNTTVDYAGFATTGKAATEEQLKAVKTELIASDKDTHIDTSKEYNVDTNNQIKLDVVDKNGKPLDQQVVINDVAKASDVGNISDLNEGVLNKDGTKTTVVDAINNIDTRVGKVETKVEELGTIAKAHNVVSNTDKNITVDSTKKTKDGGTIFDVNLNKDKLDLNKVVIEGNKGKVTAIDVEATTVNATTVTTGDTVMNNDGVKVGTDVSLNKDGLNVGEKVSVTKDAVTAGQSSISNDGLAVGPNTSLKAGELKIDGKTYINDKGINANEQKITNVAPGELSKTSMDAVNGSQLHETNINVANNSMRINKLGDRVNKVGAGAAALAALHPMDFDPDDKWSFAAGYGNYAGENAAAIGAYYRPDEKVMFSVGGTVGNGENMVNAGISFALDRTNHVSNSRTALAREVIDLRGQLAEMGAKMAKMEKAFGMLDETKTKLFPDIPANHWAYEYIAKLAGNGYIEGYPDGNFGGDRLMTRYEFAAMLYRAIENGAALEEKIIKEFEPELGRIRVDRISGEDGDRDKIERVRVNDTKGERDHYGNKLAK